MDQESHISSIIIYFTPKCVDGVLAEIALLDDVEVAAIAKDQGKLVAVIETPTSQLAERRIETIKNYKGVLSAALVYHHVEDNQSLDALTNPSSRENTL